jgi:hypothetical protein
MAGVAGAPLSDAEVAAAKAKADAANAEAEAKRIAEAAAKAVADAKAKADAEAAAAAQAAEAEAAAKAEAEAKAKALKDGGAAAALEAANEARAAAEVMREESKAELEQIKARGAELDSYLSQQRNLARVAYLRQIGASTILSDADLLTLAPNVDVSTIAGRTQIDAWREANLSKFSVVKAQPMPTLEQLRHKQGDGPVHPGATADKIHAALAANLRGGGKGLFDG